MPSFLTPLLRDPGKHYILFNTRTQQIVANTILTAFDSKSRNRGLLHHDSLPSGTVLMLAPTNAVHTFFMKFPIDVVFVRKNGTVRKVVTALRPWRLAGCFGAFATLEFAADSVSSHIQQGDLLTVTGGIAPLSIMRR
jgi:uncharacterized membrane protein (UPF0127 family)